VRQHRVNVVVERGDFGYDASENVAASRGSIRRTTLRPPWNDRVSTGVVGRFRHAFADAGRVRQQGLLVSLGTQDIEDETP
jgi:hypothetical protein